MRARFDYVSREEESSKHKTRRSQSRLIVGSHPINTIVTNDLAFLRFITMRTLSCSEANARVR